MYFNCVIMLQISVIVKSLHIMQLLLISLSNKTTLNLMSYCRLRNIPQVYHIQGYFVNGTCYVKNTALTLENNSSEISECHTSVMTNKLLELRSKEAISLNKDTVRKTLIHRLLHWDFLIRLNNSSQIKIRIKS